MSLWGKAKHITITPKKKRKVPLGIKQTLNVRDRNETNIGLRQALSETAITILKGVVETEVAG